MNKHTPGPWRIERAHDFWAEIRSGYGPANIMVSDCVDEADALLIAAAPDLLEALQVLAEHDFGTTGWTPLLERAAMIGRAAIRKATGE